MSRARACVFLDPPSPPLCWRPRGSEAESTSPPSRHPRSARASPPSTFCLPSLRPPLSFAIVDFFPSAGPQLGLADVCGGVVILACPVRWWVVVAVQNSALHSLKEFPSRAAIYAWKTGACGCQPAGHVPLKCLTLDKSISPALLLLPPQSWSIIPHLLLQIIHLSSSLPLAF